MSTAPDRGVSSAPVAHWQAVPRRVEHADTDASGVVHFARYPALQEVALLANLERLGAGLDALAGAGTALVVVESTTRYRCAARYPDELSLHPVVGHLGAARARIDTTIRRAADGAELASGSLVVAVTDRATGGPVALPAVLRSALSLALEETRHDDRR